MKGKPTKQNAPLATGRYLESSGWPQANPNKAENEVVLPVINCNTVHWQNTCTRTHTTVQRLRTTRGGGTRRYTHTHPSWSSNILYQLPPSTTIHSIHLVQFTCLTVLFHNHSPGPLWSTTWSGNPPLHTSYFTQSLSCFHNTCPPCPYHHNLFCCSTATGRTVGL